MLAETIKQAINSALKEKDSEKTGVLRLLLSELKNDEIALRGQGKAVTEESEIKVLQKEAKKRKESIEIYKHAGRNDLAKKEEYELEVINQYLPKQADRSEIEKVVTEIKKELGDNADFGAIMKASMAKLGGRADGKTVSEVVRGLTSKT